MVVLGQDQDDAAVFSCPVHHCLVVRGVPLEHERRADERDLRARSRTGHRRRPRPALLARSWGAICAGTRSKTQTMTQGAGLESSCLRILDIAELRGSRVQQPGDLYAGTQAPGLEGAPCRPAGSHQHHQQQRQRQRQRQEQRLQRPCGAIGSACSPGELTTKRARAPLRSALLGARLRAPLGLAGLGRLAGRRRAPRVPAINQCSRRPRARPGCPRSGPRSRRAELAFRPPAVVRK